MSINRRQFLKRSLNGIGTMTLALSPIELAILAKKSRADTSRRRHLINIVAHGGWDSLWFHYGITNSIHVAPLNLSPSSNPFLSFGFNPAVPGTPSLTGVSSQTGPNGSIVPYGNPIDRAFNGVNYRYGDNAVGQFPSSTNQDTTVGPIMPWAFSSSGMYANYSALTNQALPSTAPTTAATGAPTYTPLGTFPKMAAMSDLLIWRGMSPAGSHSVGNHANQTGGNSEYDAGYAALIAKQIGQTDYLRPLHYTQVAANADALYTSIGLPGTANPAVSIPDIGTIANLGGGSAPTTNINSTTTTGWLLPGVTNPNMAAQTTYVNNTVNFLGNLAINSELTLNQSQSIFSQFLSEFSGANTVAGLFATSANAAAFNSIYLKYLLTIQAALTGNGAGTHMTSMINAVTLPTLFTGTGFGGTPQTATANYADRAFSFAMAEFLVVRDYSAVVEIGLDVVDCHNQNENAVAAMAVDFACLSMLLTTLKSTSVTGSVFGNTLLDCTTVVMHAEFDRQPFMSYSNAGMVNDPGLGHGNSASMLMAGYGVSTGSTNGGQGKIIGAVATGASPSGAADVAQYGFYNPIPMDPNTGLRSTSGQVTSALAIFPTVLGLFNVAVPANQVTDWNAIPAALDPNRKT